MYLLQHARPRYRDNALHQAADLIAARLAQN
jgi:hypothetical protein